MLKSDYGNTAWLNRGGAHGKYPFSAVVDRACARSI